VRLASLSGALALALALAGPAAGRAGEGPEPQERFVVHEWGVHVRKLEMKAAADPAARPRSVLAAPGRLISDLPEFVLRHSAEYKPSFHVGAWDKPVLHFYGREGAEVSVRVLTPRGQPLAYWPKPTMVEKQLSSNEIVGPELQGIAWKGRLSAKPAGATPDVKDGHWWQAVRSVPAQWFNAESGSERFIFYEASALQEPLLTGKVGAEELALENLDSTETGPVMVIVNDGRSRRFVAVPTVAPKATVRLARKDLLSADGDAEKLLAGCRAQWESFGMTREEARAIVETWKPDLLTRTGFLVAARIPTGVYDSLFPLEIKPKPDEVVRAGVVFDTLPGEGARLDWLPGLQATLEQLARDLTGEEYEMRMAARKRLADLGDLAELFAEKLAKSPDAEVRNAVEEYREKLRTGSLVMPARLKDQGPLRRGEKP